MTDESVSVRCWIITCALWGAAGVLMLAGTIYVLARDDAAALAPLILVGWALYVVTGAAVWTVKGMIAAATRKVSSQLERLERLERRVLNWETSGQAADHPLRSLR